MVTLIRVMQRQTTPYWVDLDVPLAQVKTLLAVGDLGAPTIGQIATVLRISQPTANHLVERLRGARVGCAFVLLLLGGRQAVFTEERASLVFEAHLALTELKFSLYA